MSITSFVKNKIISALPDIPKDYSKNDIYVISYPRSGNTWLRFMLGCYLLDRQISFKELEDILPSIKKGRKLPSSTYISPSKARFIKSHSISGYYRNVIYIIRRPKKTMQSYYKFMSQGLGRYNGSYAKFFRSKIVEWADHIKYYAPKANLILHYEDMRENPGEALRQVLKYSKIDISEDKIARAIKNSSLEEMQKVDRSDNKSWRHPKMAKEGYDFIGQGEI